MKFIVLIAAATALATPAIAASPFDGSWKTDLGSVKLPTKPDVYLLTDGTYSCSSCVPVLSVKADGGWHPVKGRDYADEMMVKVVDARTVSYGSRKGGKLMGTSTDTVSADGNTLTTTFKDVSTDKPVTGSSSETRLSKGPAGSHLVSGSWKQAAVQNLSDSGSVQSFKVVGDMVTLTTPAGIGYVARAGGPAVPITGDPGKTMAAVRMAGPNTIVETDTRNGKVVTVYTMTVLPGGKTMDVAVEDRKRGTTTKFVANKM